MTINKYKEAGLLNVRSSIPTNPLPILLPEFIVGLIYKRHDALSIFIVMRTSAAGREVVIK